MLFKAADISSQRIRSAFKSDPWYMNPTRWAEDTLICHYERFVDVLGAAWKRFSHLDMAAQPGCSHPGPVPNLERLNRGRFPSYSKYLPELSVASINGNACSTTQSYPSKRSETKQNDSEKKLVSRSSRQTQPSKNAPPLRNCLFEYQDGNVISKWTKLFHWVQLMLERAVLEKFLRSFSLSRQC